MKVNRKWLTALILLMICVFIHFYSIDAHRVENGYSSRFFPVFSRFLRNAFGAIPVSIGDILYGLLVGLMIWRFIKWLIDLKKKRELPVSHRVKNRLLNTVITLSWLYIIFNIFWGINYNRKGIAFQLQLNIEKYTVKELKNMNGLLVGKINNSRQVITDQRKPFPTNRELFKRVNDTYAEAEKKYPFIDYRPSSLKSSLWGWVGNYGGFTGYYNPFTGEAQVNTSVPAFIQPFVACHEVAHQLGYAKEMEANFVAFLAAGSSTDTLFHYSVYLELFAYANRNLYRIDSLAARSYSKELIPAVQGDLDEWRKFNRKHVNPAEPVIRWLYGKFLQGNQQPEGIQAYDKVTGFIIAYYKKFGRI